MSRSGRSISEPAAETSPRRASRLRRATPLIIAAAVVAAFFALRFDRYLSFERLIESRDLLQSVAAHNRALTLCAFAFAFLAFATLAIPGNALLTFAGGFLFGGLIGGGVSAAMATAGATFLFLAARGMLHDFIVARAGRLIGRMRTGFQRNAPSYMLFLRLTPLVPFWLVTIGAALAGVPLRTFVWTTALGILPVSLLIAFAGEKFDRLVASGRLARDACCAAGGTDCHIGFPIGEILTPSTLLLLAGAALLALTPALAQALAGARRLPPRDAP